MRGKILDIHPKGLSTVYNYLCLEDDDSLL
jgi:hypothetical protein